MTVHVRDRDRGARELVRNMKRTPTVRVGVMGSEAVEKKEIAGGGFFEDTVIDIATKHEFGIGVPKRSFIADWADEAEPVAIRRLRKAAERIRSEEGLQHELNRFGLWSVGQIQKRISRRIPPKLAQSTIDGRKSRRGKGSDVPLIDTGQLRSSITHEVDLG